MIEELKNLYSNKRGLYSEMQAIEARAKNGNVEKNDSVVYRTLKHEFDEITKTIEGIEQREQKEAEAVIADANIPYISRQESYTRTKRTIA
jgi:hypothetical protein